MLLLAAACDSQLMRSHGPAPAARASVAVRGTVMGSAAACSGRAVLGAARVLVVYAQRDGRWIARHVVASAQRHGHYAFALRPGSYLIGAKASADPPELVTVRAGRTVTVNFPDACQ